MSTHISKHVISKSRRSTLKSMSMLPIVGYGLLSLYDEVKAATTASCTLAPTLTEGPYWVDEKLNRADITTDTTRASVRNGLPLSLAITVFNASNGSCSADPVPNVQVDIWHCDAAGEYSDATGNGQSSTKGQTFLRGYQFSDASGVVNFKTIYPGWYGGRATHIHVRMRGYDTAGTLSYNFTTQLFFDDSITDKVYALAPYNAKGTRDKRNSNDMHYNSVSTPILVTLTENANAGYAGDVAIALPNLPSSVLANRFSIATVATGSTNVPTLTSTLKLPAADVGTNGSIYVAAAVGENWYFNNGQSWQAHALATNSNFPAFYSGTLASSQSFVILSGIDVSAIRGSNIYLGYGQNALHMVQKGQYAKTYTL